MMKKIIRVLVLVCIVVCCCTACDKNIEGTTITTIQTEEICASYDPIAMEEPLRGLIGKTVYHNGYMFFFEKVESESAGDLYSVKRLNLLTGEISSPCKDPLCTHLNEDCPFVCGGMATPMIQFFDQYILVHSQFRDYSLAEHSRYKRILYNEKTGEWKEIFQTVSSNTNSKNAFCIDNYLYHAAYGARRTENGKVYVPTEIRRYNLKNGEEEVIYTHDFCIFLVMAGQSRLYFYEDIAGEKFRFFSVDKDGKDFRNEPRITLRPSYVYQNRIYGELEFDGTFTKSPLLIQDLNTGETLTVVEDHINGSLCIAENKLYYLTKEYYTESHIDMNKVIEEGFAAGVANPYKTEPYASKLAEIERLKNTGTAYLWQCDLDGSNSKIVMEFPGAGALYFCILDGYMYTNYTFYDVTTGEQLGTKDEQGQPCRINLTTGEVEFLHKLGAE